MTRPQYPDIGSNMNPDITLKMFFKTRWAMKSVDCEQSRLSSWMWVGLVQSVEGLRREKTEVLQGRKNSACNPPLDPSYNITLSWVSSLLAHPADFRGASSTIM